MILVIDLEATCSNDGTIESHAMEIIEVGAVWATPDGKVIDIFQRFVRPVEHPCLTRFCTELTHISQDQVDHAAPWPLVAGELETFAQVHPGEHWASWGNYDARQIELESFRHNIANPLSGLVHINLKARFAKARRIKQVGMSTALQIAQLNLEGKHHRALSDARNIAYLLPFSLYASQQCDR